MTRRAGVYLAAPLSMRGEVRWLAYSLRSRRVSVVSTWHQEAGVLVDPTDHETRWATAARCLAEVARARALVFDRRSRATTRMGLVEVGAALGAGIPVACLVDGGPEVDMGISDALMTRLDCSMGGADGHVLAWLRSIP